MWRDMRREKYLYGRQRGRRLQSTLLIALCISLGVFILVAGGYALYEKVEHMAPEIIGEKRKMYKGVNANVDFYSGFVYDMLGIPQELYTAMFAVARIVGWSAHRIEELICMDKIIRPAYMSVMEERE